METAVEWLRKELLKRDIDTSIKELFEQAKEMERQQIINAYLDGNYDKGFGRCSEVKYYNTKFNK